MPTIRKEKGVVFVIAIVGLAVMLIIGVTFMSMSIQQLMDARRDYNALRALSMADAGINHFVWQQRFSGQPIDDFKDMTTIGAVYELAPGGDPAPQITPSDFPFDDGQAAVWLFHHQLEGSTGVSFQIIAKGFYREHVRTVRGVLEGPRQSTETAPPTWTRYAVFADSQIRFNTATRINGDLATNGSMILNMANGGYINGSVYTASFLQILKMNQEVGGNLNNAGPTLDKKNNPINPLDYFTGSSSNVAPKIVVDGMNSAAYADWASHYQNATFSGTTISSASQITTPILYCNPSKTAPYQLEIDADLKGPLTIFVNGDIYLNGNIKLGTATAPISIIGTGSLICKGTPTIYGTVWMAGPANNGTPNVIGSLRCSTVSDGGNGNPSFTWKNYGDIVTPPDFNDAWRLSSWEIL